jgi:hypothetical protein
VRTLKWDCRNVEAKAASPNCYWTFELRPVDPSSLQAQLSRIAKVNHLDDAKVCILEPIYAKLTKLNR